MKLSALLHSKLFIGIAAGVTAAAAATTAFFLTHKSDEEYRVIKVFEKTGTSIVTRPDVGDIKPYVGMNLESGDSVCTYKDSTMRISLDNTKYMFMEPETRLELEASGNKNDSRTKIILKSGSVLNEITKPLSSDSSYVVSAPKASMAVHGTSFRVFVEKVGDDYIITLYAFEGTVKVTLLDENGNDTSKTASVTKDKCVKIKTVHNSSKDPSEDGTSAVAEKTFGEMDHETDVWATYFFEQGFSRGKTVLLLVPPGEDLLIATFALLRLGAVPIVIDPGMGLKNFFNCVRKTQPNFFLSVPRGRLLYYLLKPFTGFENALFLSESLCLLGLSHF